MYIMKLKPAFKDYLWGGTRLRDDYGLDCDLDIIAEGWMLSCHKDGNSVIENGKFQGLTLREAIEKSETSIIGTNAEEFEDFPILIKLIDAKQNLSIQVHPDDEYALKVEHEFGKTEMWYVVDCEDGAYLYYGFKEEISKAQFKEAIENNTLTDILNKVEVKKGDCFFIESGTVHAIGAGLLIAEIQQNSNTTYRVYDYGRVGADGKPRELHTEKALDVTVTAPPKHPVLHDNQEIETTLAECKYFEVKKHSINGNIEINVDSTSFSSLLCVEGQCTVGDVPIKAGECVFIPANMGSVIISGNAILLESRV
ncbi:MAG: class I mannose-6-phosphate isomerase [Clostridia bacterium]|nr:class I mannose-6-phosphate isomerase [Clostridia bacterium]